MKSAFFYDKIKKTMHGEIHIGKLILQKLKEKEHSVAWLARKVSCDSSNMRKILKNNYIHSELLFRISTVLDEDFFAYFSQKLNKINESKPISPKIG